jgi:hypothetical protein
VLTINRRGLEPIDKLRLGWTGVRKFEKAFKDAEFSSSYRDYRQRPSLPTKAETVTSTSAR